MSSGRFWPVAIVALLALNVAIVAFTVIAAKSDPGFAVEPDFYRRGLAWDESARQRDLNRALGWSLTISVAPSQATGAPASLVAAFSDGAGAPIRAAQLVVEAFHEGEPAKSQRLTLTPEGDGSFTSPLTLHRSGLWRFRAAASAVGATFTSETQLELSAVPRASNPGAHK